MAYYDRIAVQWERATGYKGGAFKAHVLNEALLARIAAVEGAALLELGAGNGYFLPLLLDRFSGQQPARITITDVSSRMLDIARQHHPVTAAGYQQLDVRRRFPFDACTFDLVLASMVFNEVGNRGLDNALGESYRVLRPAGRLLATVIHPDFVADLHQRGQLRRERGGPLTMPGAGNLRLPVIVRSVAQYQAAFSAAGFQYEAMDIYPTEAVLNEKPGLRKAGRRPLALLLAGTRPAEAG